MLVRVWKTGPLALPEATENGAAWWAGGAGDSAGKGHIHLPCDPAVLLSGVCPGDETRSHTALYLNVFLAAWLIYSPKLDLPKCPSTGERCRHSHQAVDATWQ